MTLELALTFAAANCMFVAAPGPSVIAVASRSLRSGVPSALRMSLGILTGDTIYLCFALFGLATLAEQVGEFFVILRFLGAAYLVYLGVRIWRETAAAHALPPNHNPPQAYWSGLLISLGNPKVIFFYLGFLPAFWDLRSLSSSDQLLIIVLSLTCSFLVLSLYAVAADRLRPVFTATVRRVTDRLAGGFLIFFGVKAAATP